MANLHMRMPLQVYVTPSTLQSILLYSCIGQVEGMLYIFCPACVISFIVRKEQDICVDVM